MSRGTLEVADVFRRYGADWRAANAGHVNLTQRRVMTAIEICRTAALGGHVESCTECAHTRIAYNSCRNRHCPKCQWRAAEKWLKAREAELLPVPYIHVVFTVPSEVGAIAYQNKAVVYGLLMKAAADTLMTIAADQKHLGAQIGVTTVLHTWGQNLDHHPHVHCIVAGGGISADGNRWVACRPGFFLPVRVLSRLFRRRFLDGLIAVHDEDKINDFGAIARLQDRQAFCAHLTPLRKREWVVYAKEPFAGPGQVLAYLARYTHRVAISNRRLISIDSGEVRFRWKDYRHHCKRKAMTLSAGEFIRRFLMHVLPDGFHRIRHYGLLANGHRATMLERCRALLGHRNAALADTGDPVEADTPAPKEPPPCPCCGGRMVIIESFEAGRHQHDTVPEGLDSS